MLWPMITSQHSLNNWRDTTHFDSEDDYRQVVETSVTVNNNRSIQDYVLPDDQTQPTFINLVKTILTSSRNLKMSYVTRPCWL